MPEPSITLNPKPGIPQPEILNPEFQIKSCLEDRKIVLVEDHPRDGLVGPALSLQETLKRARTLAKVLMEPPIEGAIMPILAIKLVRMMTLTMKQQ